MTDQQITAIAREFAKERCSTILYDTFADSDRRERDLSILAVEAKAHFQWLLQRYCLVEKSKLIEEYKSAKRDSKVASREKLYSMFALAEARKALLQSLFPEIAKEVEE